MADLAHTPLIEIGAGTSVPVKISKEAVGYVHREGTDYRCHDCVLFIPGKKRCAFHGEGDQIKSNAYCIYWGDGKPHPGLVPLGCVTPKESGYGELKNGTKCIRCVYFNGSNDCRRVDRLSPGDDPGRIHPNGCCASQTPRVRI